MGQLAPATPKQQRYARQLIQQTGNLEFVACQDVSRNRASEVGELNTREANVLIQALLAELNAKPDPCDVMRKKLLHFAHEMGWKQGSSADVERVDNWCQYFGRFHKPLMEHDATELAALVTQFEAVYRSFLTGLRN